MTPTPENLAAAIVRGESKKHAVADWSSEDYQQYRRILAILMDALREDTQHPKGTR